MATRVQYGTHLNRFPTKDVIHGERKPMDKGTAKGPMNHSPSRRHRDDKL